MLHLFVNSGGGIFQLNSPNYENIDIGQFAQPQLVDVNRDGVIDLLIGEQDGTINYLPNSGTLNNAIFDTIITNWGLIDVDSNLISTGFSSPTLYDSNGVYQLYDVWKSKIVTRVVLYLLQYWSLSSQCSL